MKQKRFILILFLIVISFSFFVSAQNCSDTDGGTNYYEKGSAVQYAGDEEFTTDFCESETQLKEYYCKSSGHGIASRVYECPEGCSDGACRGNPIPLGENGCFESDERLNLYEKGQLIDKQHNANYWDTCLDENTLREYYCGPNNYLYYSFNCPNGCQDGACLELTAEQTSKSCEDSDALYPIWVNFNEKGSVIAEGGLNGGTYEESCDGDSVKEYICDLRGALEVKYDCIYGCKNGACLTPTYIEPEEDEEPLEVPKNTEETIYVCQGCELMSKCYPFGFRKEGNFCSDENNEFVEQKRTESICENNFECDSNLCIDNGCVSGSLWAKFTRWLNRIFG